MTLNVLITGGFGYVGGRVAAALGHVPDVHVVLGSRWPRTQPYWLPQASLAVTDWNEFKSLQNACAGVDMILHFAAMNEVNAERDPVLALEMNGVATARLVEAAKAEKVKRFLYLSTAHVYCSPLVGLIDETTLPRPRHPYATSHRAAEDIVLAAHDEGWFSGLVLRLSNGFGAPVHPQIDRWSLLVNDLCRQAVNGGTLRLRSSGLQRRDFVTLTDVSRAIIHLLQLPETLIGNGIFNIGGQWAATVLDMAILVAHRCEALLGFVPEIVRPLSRSDETVQPLDYRIDRLLSTGFKLLSNREEEIDATLRMCLNSMKTNQGS